MKAGDTITDGINDYVFSNDLRLHRVDSGNHAEFKVSHEKLLKMLKSHNNGKIKRD